MALLDCAPKQRKDKGKNRILDSKIQHLIEGLYLKSPHLSFANIYRKVQKYCTSKQLAFPTYRTLCLLLSRLPKPMTTLAHKGSKAYKQEFDLLHLREANHPNEIWQADHCKLDILLLNHKGNPQRPWLTLIFDDYSRGIAGYELSFLEPSALKTALALRQAIWRKKEPNWSICGIPAVLYTDHGSDFTSRHIAQVCIDLKINLIFSQVGQPRGRGKIERFFLTLNQRLLCELPGYTKCTDAHPELTLAQLEDLILQFIIKYNQTEHSQTGMAPKKRWEHNGFLPQMPESVEKLDLLLMTLSKPRTVMRDGIHFQGLRYTDPVLASYIGETVVIRYDPADITSVRTFYKDRFLCQPTCLQLDQKTIGIKAIQSARNARKKALKLEINQRLSLIDALLTTKLPTPRTIDAQEQKPPPKPALKLYAADP